MVNLKLYGQHTSIYEYVKMMVRRNTERAGIKLNIQEIDDWETIVKEKVLSLPAIGVNGHENVTLDKSEGVNAFINEVTLKILKDENYGNMTKILVPTDFSDTATNALVYASALCNELNGVIQLVHIHKPEVTYVESVVIVDEKIEQIRRKKLDDFVTNINQSWITASDNALPIDGVFKVGFVVDEITEMCKDKDEECLIIVGSTGETGGMKKLFGSVSTKLARTCKHQVLIVPPEATFEKLTSILFAVDDIELDLRVLPKLLDFASKFNSKVNFVHIKDEELYPQNELLAQAKTLNSEIKVQFDSISGPNVSQAIMNYATSHTASIISMATQKRGFFADLFHKSVTKEMTISTSIPLLILHN